MSKISFSLQFPYSHKKGGKYMNCDVKIDLALKMHSETFTKCVIISLISISTIHTRK